jgi:hypothetical protein
VGLLALTLLGLAALFSLWYPQADGASTWTAAFVRIGLVLAAAWLALPELRQVSVWFVAVTGTLLLVLARWPRYFLLALVIAAVAMFFRPRTWQRRL